MLPVLSGTRLCSKKIDFLDSTGLGVGGGGVFDPDW